jgi:hypothetical protein
MHSQVTKENRDFYIDYGYSIELQENITIWLYNNTANRSHDKQTKDTRCRRFYRRRVGIR